MIKNLGQAFDALPGMYAFLRLPADDYLLVRVLLHENWKASLIQELSLGFSGFVDKTLSILIDGQCRCLVHRERISKAFSAIIYKVSFTAILLKPAIAAKPASNLSATVNPQFLMILQAAS